MFNYFRFLMLFLIVGSVTGCSLEITQIEPTPLLQQGEGKSSIPFATDFIQVVNVDEDETDAMTAEQPEQTNREKMTFATENKVKNGTFESNTTYWFGYHKDNLTLTVDEGMLKVAGVPGNPAWWHFEATVGQVTAGKMYYASFDIRADRDETPIDFYLRKHRAPHHKLSDVQTELIGTSSRTIEQFFTATTDELDSSLLVFEVDGSTQGGVDASGVVFSSTQTIWLDNVVLYELPDDIAVQLTTPTPPEAIVYDFETAAGWIINPNGGDTATTGQWERVDPEETQSEGNRYQNGNGTSGRYALVTGGAAGADVTANDVDNGITSALSPQISLPDGSELTLSLSYYLAHDDSSTADDYLRVSWASGHTKTALLEEYGANDIDQAFWTPDREVDMTDFVGQTGHLLIEAADGGDDGIIEAAIDDIRIITVP